MIWTLLPLLASVVCAQIENLTVLHAHLVPDFDFEGESLTEIFLEFDSDFDLEILNDQDDFICSEFFEIEEEVVGEEGEEGVFQSILPRANCRFCPQPGAPGNVGILLLPQIDGLQDTIEFEEEEGPFQPFAQAQERKIVLRKGDGFLREEDLPVTIEIMPDAPTLQQGFIVDVTRLRFRFSDAVHIIRGQIFDESFETACFNLFFGDIGIESPCSVDFRFDTNEVDFVFDDFFASQFIESLREPLFLLNREDTFFSTTERFGFKPVDVNEVELDVLPRLQTAVFLDDFSFNLTFDAPMREQNFARVPCNKNFAFVAQEQDFFAGRNDLFCSFTWLDSFTVLVQFTDVIPFLVSGELFVKNLASGNIDQRVLKAANEVSFAIGSAGVFVNEDLFNLDFDIIAPPPLSLCDENFQVELNQVAGQPLLIDTSFEILEEQIFGINFECVFGSTVLICDLPDLSEFALQGLVSLTVNINVFPKVPVGVFVNALFTESVTITQNVAQPLIPVTFAGISGNNPVATLQRGKVGLFSAVLGNVFGCNGVDATERLDFLWEVRNENEEVVISVPNRKTLRIGATTLAPGVFDVSFSVRLPVDSILEGLLLPNTISFVLTITPAEVVLVNAVADEVTFGSLSNIKLDASRSCNPNADGIICEEGLGARGVDLQGLNSTEILEATGFVPATDFEIEWICVSCGIDEDIFAGLDVNQVFVDIPPENFESFLNENGADTEFVFQYNVRNIVRDETVSLDFTADVVQEIEECLAPSVKIQPVAGRVNVDQSFTLFGDVEGFNINPALSEIAFITWAIVDNAPVLDDFLDNSNGDNNNLERENLFVPANVLVEGFTYTFSLAATPKCDDNVPILPIGSATVSVATNFRPAGGVLSVNPTEGVAVQTLFTLTTSDWVDRDNDFPLLYSFEIAFVNTELLNSGNLEELKPQQTTQLRAFSPSPTFKTTLPLPPKKDVTMVLIAIAQDALGSISRRLLINGRSDIVVNNPFIVEDEVNVDVQELEILINDLVNTGDRTEVPLLCSAITSSLNELADDGVNLTEFQEDLTLVRSICLDSVQETLEVLDEDEVDITLVNLVANSVNTISGGSDQIDEELLEDIDAQVADLLQTAQDVSNAALRGGFDPASGSLLPDSYRENIVGIVSNFFAASEILTNTPDGTSVFSRKRSGKRKLRKSLTPRRDSRRRLLQDIDEDQAFIQRCQNSDSGRKNVEDLAQLQNSFVVAGAPQVDASSDLVLLAAFRENIDEVGVKSGEVIVPDDGKGSNSVVFPATFGADAANENDGVDGADLNIVAIKWNFPIRCEERVIEDVDCLRSYDYLGPREGSEGSVLSLEFVPFETDDSSKLNVTLLSEPIVLVLDAPESIGGRADVSQIAAECQVELDEIDTVDKVRGKVGIDGADNQCGFFDAETNDFITDFCTAQTFENADGVIQTECTCTHASDYASWQNFKYDVETTFKTQVFLSEIELYVAIGFFVPLTLFSVILLVWSHWKDKKDAENILKGSLARVKLLRLVNRKRKKIFFENYETALLNKVARDDILGESVKRREEDEVKIKPTPWWKLYWLSLKYEHSLLGLSRYDPNFSRFQRSAVFIAVVIASFGSAAFLYELRSNEYDISIYVTVAVSFLGAFMVSIPVKLVVRVVFKTSENKLASKQDMVNNMYKVLLRLEEADGKESETDRELVDAIHDYFRTERKVVRQQRIRRQSSAGSAGNIGRLQSRASTGSAADDDSPVPAEEVANPDDVDVVVEAKEVKKAREFVAKKTMSARSHWKEERKAGTESAKYYSSWRKVKLIRSSKGVAKFTALFADTPNKGGKSRDSCCPHGVVYFNWLALILVNGAYITYCFLFISSRVERAADPAELEDAVPELLDADFIPVTEEDYFYEWIVGSLGGLAVSYLLAEPLIGFMRYIILPKCLSMGGKDEAQLAAGDGQTLRDGYCHNAFDLLADLAENLF